MNKGLSSNCRKYSTINPVRRHLIRNFISSLFKLADLQGKERICDMGCGEGFIDSFLLGEYPSLRIEGYDINSQAINFAKKFVPNAKFSVLDIRECHVLKNNKYDLILVTEVLEHLHYCEQALNKLAKLDFSKIIISVPNEFWFSLGNFVSGKNILCFGRDSDHINFWNENNFSRILQRYFKIAEVLKPFPWMIFKCEKGNFREII